jgi:phosphate transport system permease protein
MIPRSARKRLLLDRSVRGLMVPAALLGIAVLVWILWEVVARGASALTPAFFTQLPSGPGVEGGGLANAIVGTFAMTAVATAIGAPIGLLAGVFLAEFGPRSRVATAVRFTSNLLMGTPSIIVGIFVYGILVLPLGHFSGWAGAVALAIIMLPVVVRTTEDMLTLVPDELRESGLALGAPRWKVTLGVVFRAAKTGLATGILLAVARVSGETAPLLFTSLNSFYWPDSLGQPTPNLTVTIFNYAMSPYADWQQKAWGASLLITAGVLLATVVARVSLEGRKRRSW